MFGVRDRLTESCSTDTCDCLIENQHGNAFFFLPLFLLLFLLRKSILVAALAELTRGRGAVREWAAEAELAARTAHLGVSRRLRLLARLPPPPHAERAHRLPRGLSARFIHPYGTPIALYPARSVIESPQIRRTPDKGWGVFAGQDILAGTFIGEYAGEVSLSLPLSACLSPMPLLVFFCRAFH